MSDHDKCYRRRFSDDGGEYLLIPRDVDFFAAPELTDVPVRVVLPAPAPRESVAIAENSVEVDAMVDAFFASLERSGG